MCAQAYTYLDILLNTIYETFNSNKEKKVSYKKRKKIAGSLVLDFRKNLRTVDLNLIIPDTVYLTCRFTVEWVYVTTT